MALKEALNLREIFLSENWQIIFFYIILFNFRNVEHSFYTLHNITKKKWILILRYLDITTIRYTKELSVL